MQSPVDVVAGDVSDANSVETAMRGCEVVFHLAALIGIPYSYHAPASYVATNINGTLHILQAAMKLGVEKILVTSTSEVYGTAQRVPIDEAHPLQGQSPYSATKIAADKLTESFIRSFNAPCVIVRPFNTYGPRQSVRAIIPTIITQLLAGRDTIQLGRLTPTRDFNFVEDTAAAYLAIAESDVIGEELNVASGTEISIGDLSGEIIAQINPRARIETQEERVRPEHSEVERLVGANDKILRLTEWRPRVSFTEGLAKTIQWLRDGDHLALYKSDQYNI